ncbi:transposase [Methyloversatilis sp.]|uniref:transposase n=1 Tax=Methyloversatilis sp. TaxID=2569862 RepID=UPI0027340467|nr:transposase [Methyloversatilis sp.]MDP2868357.1 transposase [Methyloversatilis sp.]MDP3454190.1 transposase [Methyloversatilis sp.]MDP3578356.1 transposase [Methyloversatilis sp.]
MFSYVSLEHRVPEDHPLRALRALVDGILANMSTLFDQRYSPTGLPPIPPEQLLRALLLQILFTLQSERQFVEQLEFNPFHWFISLGMDDVVRVGTGVVATFPRESVQTRCDSTFF